MTSEEVPTPPAPELVQFSHGQTGARAFSAIGAIYAAGLKSTEQKISVDCSKLNFCVGNLSAALAATQYQLNTIGKRFELVNLPPAVRLLLQDTGLYGENLRRPRSSVIALTPFAAGESEAFEIYVKEGLLNRGMPAMSEGVESGFFTGIHELFTNFEIHSRSRIAWACGQFLPNAGRVELTLVDPGIGIPHRIMEMGFAPDPQRAIEWAMTGNNTTRVGDVPGGLGLKVLRDFIRMNGGQLTIASHGGFWREGAGPKDMRPLATSYPGTAVTVVVNTNDQRSYRLIDEVSAGDIF